jgi:hypothetical protein
MRCVPPISRRPAPLQVVISTGKSDWERSVTEVEDTLAAYLVAVEGVSRAAGTPVESMPGTPQSGLSELRDLDRALAPPRKGPLSRSGSSSGINTPTSSVFTPALPSPVVGIFKDNETHKVSVLNGSHDSISDDRAQETVLVFPDYKVVIDVARTHEGARDLWENAVNPAVPRLGALDPTSQLRTWIIPYSCVILICTCRACSHDHRHRRRR